MIHHEVTLPTSPQRVYEVLTDGALFASVTGGRAADIGRAEGDAFSLFGGPIHGRHLELVPGKSVVQAWRTRMWEAGHYSVVRFTLTPDGDGTRFAIDHDGYPPAEHDHLSGGWLANYVEPMRKHFGA